MCNKCNEKSNNCGCEEVNAKCVIYKGVCLDNLEVCSGDNLEYIIKIINDLIAEILFDNAKGTTLSNIGEGVDIVHNENSITKDYEIRSVKKGDESIDVYLDGDTIKVSVNKDWFQDNLPEIPEPEEFVLTSNKNTILINDKNIEVNPNMFFSANDEELVITEEPDGRLKFDVKVENLIKSVGSGTPLFTGLDMTDGRNKIRTLSFESNTLDVQERANDTEGVVISINTYPEDPNMKYFYVSSDYEGSIEEGSIGRPYKTLENAVNAFIGDTSLYNRANPEFYGRGKIVLLSNIFVNEPLTLNGAIYDLGGNTIYYNGTSKMVDYDYLINNSNKGSNNTLSKSIYMNLLNGDIDNRYDGTLIHIKHYHNGTSVSQNTVRTLLNNIKIVDNSHIGRESEFTKVTDFSGNDVLVYSSNIYYSTRDLGSSLIIIENVNYTNEGSVDFKNCTIGSGLRVPLEVKNTSLNIYDSVISNSYSRFLVNAVNSDPNGYRFTPKTGLNTINLSNSYLALWNCSSQLGASPSISGKHVAVFDKSIKIKEDTSNTGNLLSNRITALIVNDFLMGVQTFNNLISFDGEVTFSSENGRFDNAISIIDAVKRESGTNILRLGLQNGLIRDVKSTTPVNIVASSAIVNKFEYTSNIGFSDDTDAKNSGLIVGNIYYNTTTGQLKRINS